MKIIFFLLIGLCQISLSLSPASADDKICFEKNSLCIGDEVYAYLNHAIINGKIDSFSGTTIVIDRQSVEQKDVARNDSASCTTDSNNKKLCAGAEVEGGKIVAVFSTGYVIFETSTGAISSKKGNQYSISDSVVKETPVPQVKVLNSDYPRPLETEVQYFQDLLKRASTAPISDFLHLWLPNQINENIDGYHLDCFKDNNLFPKKTLTDRTCSPDVLYSWGPLAKLNSLKNEISDDKQSWNIFLNNRRNIWATISPVSTYSYGIIPIRFKFKPQTHFSRSFNQDGVYFIGGFALLDFTFFKGEVLESWSYGTPEHYDEIIKDIKRFLSGKKALSYTGLREGLTLDMQAVYNAGVPERGSQDEATLRRNLTLMIKMILEDKGQVFYAPGTDHDRVKHFATDHPTYFNEQ
jgi:hypothetical protein